MYWMAGLTAGLVPSRLKSSQVSNPTPESKKNTLTDLFRTSVKARAGRVVRCDGVEKNANREIWYWGAKLAIGPDSNTCSDCENLETDLP